MTLREFYETAYAPLRLIGKADSTRVQYEHALRHWERFSGDPPIAAATDLDLAAMMNGLHAAGDLAPTINKNRRHVLAILRFAHKRRLLADVPDVEPLPEPRRVPRAWMIEEVGAILRTAGGLTGTVSGFPAADFWVSLLLVCYDSGGRIGAIIATAPGAIDFSDRTIRLVAESQKQREEQVLRLHVETTEALQRLRPFDRPLVWLWPYRREAIYRAFRKIVLLAGVEVGSGACSLFHRLRRTNASYCKAAGGDPTAQLGHSTPLVTQRYLDPRICGGPQAADVLPRPALS